MRPVILLGLPLGCCKETGENATFSRHDRKYIEGKLQHFISNKSTKLEEFNIWGSELWDHSKLHECATHSAGLLPFMGNTRSSVLGEGESLSPASKGKAALEELFSSEEEAELWDRWGTWRLRCC